MQKDLEILNTVIATQLRYFSVCGAKQEIFILQLLPKGKIVLDAE